MKNGIKVSAPATLDNLVVGHGYLSVPLTDYRIWVTVGFSEGDDVLVTQLKGDRIAMESADAEALTLDAIRFYLNSKGIVPQGMELHIETNVPNKSGLGIVHATAVATMMAAQKIYKQPRIKEEVVNCAFEFLKQRSVLDAYRVFGALGGVRLGVGEETTPIRLYRPDGLYFVLYSQCEMEIDIAGHLSQKPEDSALFSYSMQQSNLNLLRSALKYNMHDNSLTGFLKDWDVLCRSVEAIGWGSQGSGKTLFAICDNDLKARQISDNLLSLSSKLESHVLINQIDQEGLIFA